MSVDSQALSAGELAIARGRAYELFGLLFQHGLTEEYLPAVLGIPEIAAVISGEEKPGGSDFDRFAANHYTLFGLNVFPHESIFLDEESNLGGQIASEVAEFYLQAGYDFLQAVDNPDHAGQELALLSFLAFAEADAWEDGLSPVALRMRDMQSRFLDDHLLRWLPGLSQAIRQQGESFYTALADLALALAVEHRSALAEDMVSQPVDFRLPAFPNLLADEKTGLKDIARYLLTPACSGLYLSRDDLSRLASGLGIPRGFGSRQQMLTNLFRSAADYEQLPILLERFSAFLETWIQVYAGLHEEQGLLRPFTEPWLERLGQTGALLTAITSQIK